MKIRKHYSAVFIIVSACMACNTPSSEGQSWTQTEASGVSGKADSTQCANAAVDTAGRCRIAGRFAPKYCCGLRFDELESSDPLSVATLRIRNRWRDRNISTGDVELSAGLVAGPATPNVQMLIALHEAEFAAQVEEREGEMAPPAPVNTTIQDEGYEETALAPAAKIASEGFALDPQSTDSTCQIRWEIEALFDWQGFDELREEVVTLQTSTVIAQPEEPNRNLTLTTFYNPNNRKYLSIYLREGSL